MSNIDKSLIQTSDIGKVFSLERNIASRTKRGLASDKLIEKLQSLTDKSSRKTERIDTAMRNYQIEAELPIAQKAPEIIKLIQQNQVVIVAGETGCGKTTQLPKICVNAGLGRRGKVAHTQPRRVAATSVASRIAQEVATPLGELVGYSVRFKDKTSHNTRIKLMTDGILLAELQSDPLLSQYEVIIIDEAHERSLNIDFLLGFLKNILTKRPELKLIVTSATIDPESFSKYFNNAPVVLVEGRTYPVEVIYQPLEDQLENDSTDDPIFHGVANAIDQCISHSTGDILVFSHGENEIKNLDKFLSKRHLNGCEIHPLFARLGIKEQQAIFNPSSKRKIIIATNVAETSLTIPNIVFVIDIGTARISRYSQRNKIQQLPVEKISRASADQRKGRCGRIAAGVCYRLYSQDDFDSRPEFTEPEISRTNLSSVVLRLKSMRVRSVEVFPFIQMPEERQWTVAFNLLYELAAVDSEQHLTDIGKKMANMAVDPQLARILLEPSSLALNEMLVISSFLSVRDVRMRPLDKQQKAEQCHAQYRDENSDVLSIIKLWFFLDNKRAELSSSKFKRWCQEHFINFVGWLEWRNVYFQTKETVVDMGLSLNKQKASDEQIHRGLIYGFVGHLLRKTQEHYYQGARGLKVWLHPSSVLFKKKSEWLVSTELVETDKIYARSNFPIQAQWIEQAVPHLVKNNYFDIHWRKNKGHAAYFLNQTVLGLLITAKRLVNSSNIDAKASRELFLLEGLAKDQLPQSFPFLTHNRKLLAEIRSQQQKLRQSDIRISDQQLAKLYEEILPSNIVSVQSLKKWLKNNWDSRNKLLSFNQQQLVNKQADTLEQYPSEILVKGVSLPVSYSFAPGTAEDGMSVEIPNEMLVQFNQSDFEWLVPGYLSEKLQAVIKNLPKPIRKQLIPVADTAEECYQWIIRRDYQAESFKSILIKALISLRDVKINAEMINLDDIPSHLKMKFKTSAAKGKNLILSTQLTELKSRVVQKKIHSSQPKQAKLAPELIDWPAAFKGLEYFENRAGQKIRIFSGLKEHQQHVSVENFPDLIDAKYHHARGVARLLLLSQFKTLRSIKNSWPDRKELERLNLRFGGFSELLNWVAFSAALKLVDSQKPVVDNNDYQQLVLKFNHQLRQEVSQTLNQCLTLLKRINAIYLKLSNLTSEVYTDSVEDIKTQIAQLWNEPRLLQKKQSLLSDYSRYFDAMEYRILRVQENFPKEQQNLESWLEWQEWWDDLQNESLSASQQQSMNELFWMLQEFSICLFAPKVRVIGSVSSKKLQKQFERLEQQLIH
jgi:ATP-dependent helicase HrpA